MTTYTADEICKHILELACDYCRISYKESDGVLQFYSLTHDRSVDLVKGKEELYSEIFVIYIHNNTNMDKTVIEVSSLLK